MKQLMETWNRFLNEVEVGNNQERSPGVSNADAYDMISSFIQGSDYVDDKKKRELLAALRKTFTDGGKCDIALDDTFGEGYLSEDDMGQIIEAWKENIDK